MNKVISERIYFKVPESLYKKLLKIHLNFYQKTEYTQAEDIKKFFILLIKEWEEELKKEKRLQQADKDIIAHINRKGQRVYKIPFEGKTIRIDYIFKKEIKNSWNNIIYTIVKEENFSNMKEYSNAYFFPHILDFATKNLENLIGKYGKTPLQTLSLNIQDKVIIQVENKKRVKEILGKIEKIEKTFKGITIKVKRDNI